jgi:hypothetical protein
VEEGGENAWIWNNPQRLRTTVEPR